MLIILCFNAVSAEAKPDKQVVREGRVTKLPVPRFVTLKTNNVNLRVGPGQDYGVKIIYKCRNHPIQVIDEFENWRLLRDQDGKQGWSHERLISGRKSVVVITQDPTKQVFLMRLPSEKSRPIAKLEVGAVAKLQKCDQNNWCKVIFAGPYSGWVKKVNLFGAT